MWQFASRLCARFRCFGWLLVIGSAAVLGCSDPASTEIEVSVSRVALDPNSLSPVVLLEDKEGTLALPIWIGPAEAQAIAMRLEGIDSPRPLTHDLMKNVLDHLGIELRKVVIRELRDNTYYARLVLLWEGEEVEIDCRPSDAIALAVRFKRPIFVSAQLLQHEDVVKLRQVRGSQTMTLGGVTVQVLSQELAEYFRLPPGRGVVVSDVAVEAAGSLHRGDVILEVDGRPVLDLEDFRAKVSSPVRPADLSVHRNGDRIHLHFGPAAKQALD